MEARERLRSDFVTYLRRQYMGPLGGPDEVLRGKPGWSYLVGTIYPRGQAALTPDGSVLSDDRGDEALDEPVELANAWHPASAAISFLHDGDAVVCSVSAGRYERDGAEHSWRRIPLHDDGVALVLGEERSERVTVLEGRASLLAVWRRLDDAWLVTVALENAAVNDDDQSSPRPEDCLFQVHLRCTVIGGAVLPYPSSAVLSDDAEEQELRLMYRDRRVFGVGHGCSVNWAATENDRVEWVETEMLPSTVVPDVKAVEDASGVTELRHLADESILPQVLEAELSGFLDQYEDWIESQIRTAESLPPQHQEAAERLLKRMSSARVRMREGITLLCGEGEASERIRLAFRLANRAMRDQIIQSRHSRRHPGRRGHPLPAQDAEVYEPAWRPFQLAFQLMVLPSTVLPGHEDRELVDLIWFPTGGGKTEAYLALAATEMIHRRMSRGIRGGGTAVITRYTLRLLTAQQFQRAATLICSLELMRHSDERLRGMEAFTIGLWVGGETTPNSFKEAHEKVKELRRAQTPESPFQLQQCPWCGSSLLPARRTTDDGAYGVRASEYDFVLFCPHPDCPFHEELPVLVVDEQIFNDPPTMVVATVDKFARLPWVPRAGSILGKDNSPFDTPSLVIQDELHLLSGPLGTTVALYEAAIASLLSWDGPGPKVVASTATIRAASDQVRNLFGCDVALFPPSGLSADDSYFAQKDLDSPGRLYLGLMPQAFTQSYATVLACVALVQGPIAVGGDPSLLDSYWTVVGYHNSLRELGRTVTIVRDDVESLLRNRDFGDSQVRQLSRDGVIELTSNVAASQLVGFLARLEKPVGDAGAVDFVATTNMLSVGIDISRLGLMLMNGQPKTTSEYIQATSRVGRGDVPGLVVTLLRASKPRDRSHYEGFRAYHESLYRHVEPTSVTPWSLSSRDRALHAALVLLVRHGCGLRDNEDAGRFSSSDPLVRKAEAALVAMARRADPREADSAEAEVHRLVQEWDRWARQAQEDGKTLVYSSNEEQRPTLLRDFGAPREGWPTMHSMRSVDRQVRVLAVGEQL